MENKKTARVWLRGTFEKPIDKNKIEEFVIKTFQDNECVIVHFDKSIHSLRIVGAQKFSLTFECINAIPQGFYPKKIEFLNHPLQNIEKESSIKITRLYVGFNDQKYIRMIDKEW